MEHIEIEGIFYRPKIQPEPVTSRGRLRMMAIMAMMFHPGLIDMGNPRAKNGNKKVINIPEEYKLVREKKSLLSRKDREWVESVFHLKYEKVENPGDENSI